MYIKVGSYSVCHNCIAYTHSKFIGQYVLNDPSVVVHFFLPLPGAH